VSTPYEPYGPGQYPGEDPQGENGYRRGTPNQYLPTNPNQSLSGADPHQQGADPSRWPTPGQYPPTATSQPQADPGRHRQRADPYQPGAGASAYPPGAGPSAYPPGAGAGGYPPGAAAGQYPPGAGAYPPGAAAGQYPPGAGAYPPGAAAGQYPPQQPYPPGAAPGGYSAGMPGGYPAAPYQAGPYGQGAYAPGAYPPGPYPYPQGGYGYGGPRSYLQGAPVTFGQAMREGLHNIFVYRGRASRSAYWWYVLFEFIVLAAIILVSYVPLLASHDTGGVAIIFGLIGLLGLLGFVVIGLAQISLFVRRLHDTGRSGWWYFIGLVPFGGIVLLVFALTDGTPGPNSYG
jgi:uncharacterized membrane protein YhaH (DUF805 family)